MKWPWTPKGNQQMSEAEIRDRAFELFDEGKQVIDVCSALDIPAARAKGLKSSWLVVQHGTKYGHLPSSQPRPQQAPSVAPAAPPSPVLTNLVTEIDQLRLQKEKLELMRAMGAEQQAVKDAIEKERLKFELEKLRDQKNRLEEDVRDLEKDAAELREEADELGVALDGAERGPHGPVDAFFYGLAQGKTTPAPDPVLSAPAKVAPRPSNAATETTEQAAARLIADAPPELMQAIKSGKIPKAVAWAKMQASGTKKEVFELAWNMAGGPQ